MTTLSGSLPALIAALSASAALAAETSGSIDSERLSQTVKVLASDEFQGRAPGTAGETKTLVYTFNEVGELEYGCHVPGHYEAGMKGDIIVEAAHDGPGA